MKKNILFAIATVFLLFGSMNLSTEEKCSLISQVCLDFSKHKLNNITTALVSNHQYTVKSRVLPYYLNFKYKRSFEFNDMRNRLPFTDLIKRHDLFVMLGSRSFAFTYRIRFNSPTLSSYFLQGLQCGLMFGF